MAIFHQNFFHFGVVLNFSSVALHLAGKGLGPLPCSVFDKSAYIAQNATHQLRPEGVFEITENIPHGDIVGIVDRRKQGADTMEMVKKNIVF